MNKNQLTAIGVGVAAFLVLFVWMGPFYILQAGEQALVTEFGKVVGTEKEPGLKMKVPGIQNVNFFSNRIMTYDAPAAPMNAAKGIKVVVDVSYRWRIQDLKKFYEVNSNGDMAVAMRNLSARINAKVSDVVGENTLDEILRNSNHILDVRKDQQKDQSTSSDPSFLESEVLPINKGRRALSKEMLEKASAPDEAPSLGIELIDVLIKQIRYQSEVEPSVYARMISDRKKEAAVFRSEGEGQKNEIIGKKERELQSIISDGNRQADIIRGQGDAEAAAIYAQAYQQDPEFYAFWKAIQSYKDTLPGLNKTMTTDADYFRYLYSPRGR